ncbi:sensor histidine kinase, partial [Actinoplanes sp. GCM10030250]|uniref:sensor histidine kinase n=1 Tax=Actinoplanes sp. GCM10030250 TaxID=3273376 RepID=UPI003619F45D
SAPPRDSESAPPRDSESAPPRDSESAPPRDSESASLDRPEGAPPNRSDDAPLRQPADERLRPTPSLADLDDLIQTTTAAGVAVDMRWLGHRRSLPADVELSAYRIVQESLTNVLRHAGAGACQVSVGYGPGELAIEVVDYGHGTTATGSGFGLIGLQERVALLNGTMTAGPRDDGGFQVAARLPVEPGAGE